MTNNRKNEASKNLILKAQAFNSQEDYDSELLLLEKVARNHRNTNSPKINAAKRRLNEMLKPFKVYKEWMSKARGLLKRGHVQSHLQIMGRLKQQLEHVHNPLNKALQAEINRGSRELAHQNARLLKSTQFIWRDIAVLMHQVDPKILNKEVYDKTLEQDGFHIPTRAEMIRKGNLANLAFYFAGMVGNMKFEKGLAPIHELVLSGVSPEDFKEKLEVLLKMGETVDRKTEQGRTALHMVCSLSGKLAHAKPYTEILLEKGASTKLGANENGLLLLMAYSENVDAVNLLMQTNLIICLNIKIKPELVPLLDAGEGVVIAFINGEPIDSKLRKFKGFQRAISSMEDLGEAYLESRISLESVVDYMMKIERFKTPHKPEKKLQKEIEDFRLEMLRAKQEIEAGTALAHGITVNIRDGNFAELSEQITQLGERMKTFRNSCKP